VKHGMDGRWNMVPGNVQRFRGGLVIKAHRLCVSVNSRLESNKEEERWTMVPAVRELEGAARQLGGSCDAAHGGGGERRRGRFRGGLESNNEEEEGEVKPWATCHRGARSPGWPWFPSPLGSRVQGSGFRV